MNAGGYVPGTRWHIQFENQRQDLDQTEELTPCTEAVQIKQALCFLNSTTVGCLLFPSAVYFKLVASSYHEEEGAVVFCRPVD